MTYLPKFVLICFFLLSVCHSYAQPDLPQVKTIYPTFTTVDVPGAGYTGVFGINSAGDMVGNYGSNTNLESHGFLYSHGTFTYFDYPGEAVTVPTGINDSGLISGYAGQGPVLGFVYDGSSFRTIMHGSDTATPVLGINNSGELVGGTGTIYATKGFALVGSRFKLLNVPGVDTYVYGSGVNKSGTLVGWTDYDGFLCRGGNCQIFDFPGAGQTKAQGINDPGLIVGWYASSTCGTCAFVSRNKTFVSFSYPGALATSASGINLYGQIVGEYTFDYQVYHGFVTSPVTAAEFEEQ